MSARRYDARPLEKKVEESMRKAILKEQGVHSFRKNASAGIFSDKSFPDRTLRADFGFVMEVEVKRLGEVANEDQAKVHKGLRDYGHRVYCLDNTPDLIEAYRKEFVAWLEMLAPSNPKAKKRLVLLRALWLARPKKSVTPRSSAPVSPRGRVRRAATKS